MRKLMPLLCAGTLVLVVAIATAAAVAGNSNDRPVSGTPGGQNASGPILHDARLDLAKRLGIDARHVILISVQHAGWDGCLGVYYPGAACTMQFIGGVRAVFEAQGRQYVYHIAGDRLIATDWEHGARIDPGLPVDPIIQANLPAMLADYARGDLALRTGARIEDVNVIGLFPVDFPDGCMGFLPEGQDVCTDVIAPGAIVFLASGGQEYRYHVGETGGVVPVSFLDGEITFEPLGSTPAYQDAIREDLATRLGRPVSEISVHSFEPVTWPDGCLGVHRDGYVCTQALVPGFLAKLTDASGKLYTYHGSDAGAFIAVDFERDATVTPPILGDE
jgi:hypothetical protein